MANKYTALVFKDVAANATTIIEHNKIVTDGYQRIVVSFSLWESKLQDRSINLTSSVSISHHQYQFVTVHTDFQNLPHFGNLLEFQDNNLFRVDNSTLSEFRDVTAQELFTLYMDLNQSNNSIDIHALIVKIPQSLVDYTFLQWVTETFPVTTKIPHPINPTLAKIMTGAQFNQVYPYILVRMLHYKMIHNNFQWKLDQENICPDFCPITQCGFGLYFILHKDRHKWVKYNGNIMYWIVSVKVPDHATVKIEDGKFAASSLYIFNRRKIDNYY